MAYKSILPEETPEPEVEEPAGPDPMEQRLADLDAQLKALYAQNKGHAAPQVQYVPVPYGAPQPQVEETPEFNDADDLAAYIQRETDRLVAERENRLREEVGSYLGSVLEDQFEAQLEKLKANPRFQYVEDELQAWMENTSAAERFSRGALKRKYNELIGEKADVIAAEERKADEAITRERAVEEPVPVKRSVVAMKKKEPPKLSASQREAMEAFTRAGFPISAEEFAAIEDGYLDWTKSMARPAREEVVDE